MKNFLSYFTAFIIAVGIVHAGVQVNPVHFRMPDSLGKRSVVYSYPIYCDDSLTMADSIFSGEFSAVSNSIFTVTGFDTAGTILANAQSILYNNTTKKIVFANVQPVTGKGVFIYLKISVNAAAQPGVIVPVSLSGVLLNEGTPSVAVTNGSFRPMDIFISPKTLR